MDAMFNESPADSPAPIVIANLKDSRPEETPELEGDGRSRVVDEDKKIPLSMSSFDLGPVDKEAPLDAFGVFLPQPRADLAQVLRSGTTDRLFLAGHYLLISSNFTTSPRGVSISPSGSM